jgi:hypothetical protein
VKLYSSNIFIRGFAGDIVVILMIYFLIKVFYDFNSLKLAVFTLFTAFTTEFLQYFKLIDILKLQNNKAARLILGSVFDPCDLAAYAIGAVLVYIIDTRLIRKLLNSFGR